MRKFALAATLAVLGAASLSACNKQDNQQATVQQAKATKPTNPDDSKAWNEYLGQIVQSNMQGMTAERPYPYLVPAGSDADAQGKYDRQLSNVHDVIARGVLPGNMLVFAGANSSKTADFIQAAFAEAKPGAFKDVIVLFIGDQSDKDRVDAALKPTGATERFVAM